MIEEVVELGFYSTISAFVTEAIREKLKREFFWLYFRKVEKKTKES